MHELHRLRKHFATPNGFRLCSKLASHFLQVAVVPTNLNCCDRLHLISAEQFLSFSVV